MRLSVFGVEVHGWLQKLGQRPALGGWEEDPRRRGWREGRGWLRLGDEALVLSAEWTLLRGRWDALLSLEHGATMGHDLDRRVQLGLRLPLLGALWLAAEGRVLPQLPRGEHRAHLGEGQLQLDPWGRGDGSWHSSDPWWRRGFSVDFADLLFGPEHVTSREREVGPARLHLPEGVYLADVTETLVTRRRWHLRSDTIRLTFERLRPAGEFILCGPCKGLGLATCASCRGSGTVRAPGADGIPIPGKGENPWDCGLDAIYSCSLPDRIRSVPEGVGYLVGDVLRLREDRGGKDWWPPSREEEAAQGQGGSDEEAGRG